MAGPRFTAINRKNVAAPNNDAPAQSKRLTARFGVSGSTTNPTTTAISEQWDLAEKHGAPAEVIDDWPTDQHADQPVNRH